MYNFEYDSYLVYKSGITNKVKYNDCRLPIAYILTKIKPYGKIIGNLEVYEQKDNLFLTFHFKIYNDMLKYKFDLIDMFDYDNLIYLKCNLINYDPIKINIKNYKLIDSNYIKSKRIINKFNL